VEVRRCGIRGAHLKHFTLSTRIGNIVMRKLKNIGCGVNDTCVLTVAREEENLSIWVWCQYDLIGKELITQY